MLRNGSRFMYSTPTVVRLSERTDVFSLVQVETEAALVGRIGDESKLCPRTNSEIDPSAQYGERSP